MKIHLFTFNFKNLLFGVSLGIFLIFIGSLVVEYIIENSNHRLSKVFSSKKIEETVFFVGNSRAVPFNNKNLDSSKKILNLSQNSMNSFQVENIIKAIKSKVTNKKTIFIELTSLANYEIQCQYSIFYNLNYYFEKKKIEEKCKKKYLIEKIIPISKLNNELFLRVLYYFLFPEKDQLWTNNYKMPKAVCNNPSTSELMSFFFKKSTERKVYEKSNYLIDLYSDENTEILFFISPIYQKRNYALEMENNYIKNNLNNLVKLNSLLSENFFKNCNMFADTLHLSSEGVQDIYKNKIFDNF